MTVMSNAPIIRVDRVFTERRLLTWIPTLVVLRNDHRKYEFSEADFAFLSLDDLAWLYNFFRNLQIKPFEAQCAQKAVVRYMKMKIRLAIIQDFQIALEAHDGKINLTKPNQDFPGGEMRPYLSIFKTKEPPEEMIVYRNNTGDLRVMRFSELAKYSDGTILTVEKALKQKIEESKAEGASDWVKSAEILKWEDTISTLKRQRVYRRGIRKLQTLLGYRKSSRWTRS